MQLRKSLLPLLALTFLYSAKPARAEEAGEAKNNININTLFTKHYSEIYLKLGKPSVFFPKNYFGIYLKLDEGKASREDYAMSSLELKVIKTRLTLFTKLNKFVLMSEARTETTLPGFSFFENIKFGGGYGRENDKKLQNVNSTFNLKRIKIGSLDVGDLELALGYTKLNSNSNFSGYILSRFNNIPKLGDLFVALGYNNHNYFGVIGNPTFAKGHCSVGGKSFRLIPIYNSIEKSFRLYSVLTSNAYFGIITPVLNLANIDADRLTFINKEFSLYHDFISGLRNPYRKEQLGRGLAIHSYFERSPKAVDINIEPIYNFSKKHPYYEEPYDLADGFWIGFLCGVNKDRYSGVVTPKYELKGGLTVHGYSLNIAIPLLNTKAFEIYAAKNLRFGK